MTSIPHLKAQPALGLALVLSLCWLAAIPAEASGRKARKLWEQARKAELAQRYEQALDLYEQALVEDPGDPRYQLAVHRARFVTGQVLVQRGRQLRQEGQLEEAAAAFQRALEVDPASSVAAQERQRTMEMIEERNRLGPDADSASLAETPLERVRGERDKRIAALKPPPELQPISTQPINLTIPNQDSKVVFETIGKLAGINPIFDPEYRDKKVSIDLQNATLYEALDYASLLAKAFWKPLSHNAIFITNDDTNKRRDYDEEVVKTFYLTNVATPQELQEVATAIRGLTDIRRLFAVNSLNALIVRGPADKMALAEKVIADIDKARPEVIIDVLVLETSKTAAREFGITPVSGGNSGINLPVSFTGEGVGAGDSGVPLSQLGNLSSRDWSTVLPGGVIRALMTRGDTRLLQSPRVRAADNFQATLNIGSRVPVATGSFQPGIGGVGVNPLVNTQFNYVEVGVNLSLTPKIHNDREVSLHIEVEVSNVSGEVDIGGIKQPTFGQRKVAHDIRIQEGETSVMGGLLDQQLRLTKSGVPLLGDIPILGHLFSSQRTETTENEILIVLIPHIVRLPEIKMANLKSVASGTDQTFRVRYEENGNGKPALPPVGESQQPETPGTQIAETPGLVPAPLPLPGQTQPEPERPADVPPAQAPATPEQPPAIQPALSFDPVSPQVVAGQQVSVNVVISNVNQLFGVPLRIGWDPKILRLVEITRGPFLQGAEQDLIFSRNIRNEVGQAAVNISRFPGTGGMDGGGVLVTLQFEGVETGSSNIRVTPTGARDATTQPVPLGPAQTVVNVQ